MSWAMKAAGDAGFACLSAKMKKEVFAELLPGSSLACFLVYLLFALAVVMDWPQYLCVFMCFVLCVCGFFTAYFCFMWIKCHVDYISSKQALLELHRKCKAEDAGNELNSINERDV